VHALLGGSLLCFSAICLLFEHAQNARLRLFDPLSPSPLGEIIAAAIGQALCTYFAKPIGNNWRGASQVLNK